MTAKARHNLTNAARRIAWRERNRPQPDSAAFQLYAFRFSFYTSSQPEDAPREEFTARATSLDMAVRQLKQHHPNAFMIRFEDREPCEL